MLVAVAALMAVCWACGGTGSPARKIKRLAERTNRSCPLRINESITLDSTLYDEKAHALSYFYTVEGEADDSLYMEAHRSDLEQALYRAVENSAEMETFRQLGTSLRYVYYSASRHTELAAFSLAIPR